MDTIKATKSTGRVTPPYLPASTFMTVIESWRAVRPSRVERGVLTKVAGSMQTWFLAALKYFGLIDDDGVPTAKLDAFATANEEQRPRLIAEMLRAGYPFLFTKGVDLTNITYSDLKKKFEETGAQGETAVKAITFFTGMAKMAGMKVSPFISTRQRKPGGTNSKKPPKKSPEPRPIPDHTATEAATPMAMLIEMLNVQDMDKDEQAAVWTLIRYLKKAGS